MRNLHTTILVIFCEMNKHVTQQTKAEEMQVSIIYSMNKQYHCVLDRHRYVVHLNALCLGGG